MLSGLAVACIPSENASMIPIDSNGYFITGSDTDVGKTYIGCELIRQLRAQHQIIEVRKPAESGCVVDESGQLVPADANKLSAANNHQQDIERIAPYRFEAALAPHRAAKLEGQNLELTDLIDACSLDDSNNLLLVEGAGGFYSPLAEGALNADLASALQLPLIIVVNDRIGAVNQALMTIQAIESRHLTVAAVIMNQAEAEHEANMDNAADLRQHCGYSVFRCCFQQSLPAIFQSEVNA